MEFKGGQQTNVPANGGAAPQPAAPRFGNNGGVNMNSSDSNKKMAMVAVLVVVLLVVAGLGVWAWKQMSGTSSAVEGNKYQALFLTNGQVYFGKLASVDDKYVKLTDIYYLQVQQSVQPTDNKSNNNSNPQVSLAKLGSELHGPEDAMYVNRDQVLFWENLKDDGKVVDAIHKNQK